MWWSFVLIWNFVSSFWLVNVTLVFTLLGWIHFKILFIVLIIVLPFIPAYDKIKESSVPTGYSEVLGWYTKLLPLLMFTWIDVLNWSITHQGYPFILWKTCFRYLSSFTNSVSFEQTIYALLINDFNVPLFQLICVNEFQCRYRLLCLSFL